MKILDLGCGKRKRSGAVGLDINPNSDADVLHDLNIFPYPFETSTFDEIYVDNVAEHADDVIKLMEELYRIRKPQCLVKIIAPYFRSKWAYVDPTHKHFFTADSFAYFDPSTIQHKLYPYSCAIFSLEKTVFNENITCSLLKKIMKKLADYKPGGYEYYLSHLFPMDDITFYLRVKK